MARLISLADAIDGELDVLFDTNTLISGFKQREGPGPLRDLIVRIAYNRRFATELVLWQFLRQAPLTRDEIEERRKWYRNNNIRPREARPAGYHQTFMSLLRRPDARGDAVDAALASYSIASGGSCVIATSDGDDFCWHSDIYVLADFLPELACA